MTDHTLILEEVWIGRRGSLRRIEDTLERWQRDLPRPRYRWLTASFVAWAGLERIPLTTRRHAGIVAMAQGGTLPPPGSQGWAEGVEFEGWTYRLADDGPDYWLHGPSQEIRRYVEGLRYREAYIPIHIDRGVLT